MNFIEEFNIDLDICDDLIVYMETKGIQVPGVAGFTVDYSKKKSVDCCITDRVLLDKYIAELTKCVNLYSEKYQYVCTSPWAVKEYVNIQKYKPGDAFYKWHCERNGGGNDVINKRFLVFMTYLNDVTDGGETEFYHQNVKFQPKKGRTLIWPVDWTHTPRRIPSMTQTTYIVTGWISFTNQPTANQ